MFLGCLAAVSRPSTASGAVAPRSGVESVITGLADRDFAVLHYEAERICRKYRELSPNDAGDLARDAFQAVIEARRYCGSISARSRREVGRRLHAPARPLSTAHRRRQSMR